ncbi:MAG: UDP-N-acetylmuramate--L-alanine ligase [Firmicutes bacterium]|nr:UDP-N-acetylmuramate--L-alanine ligase [Bacillota bacterium]
MEELNFTKSKGRIHFIGIGGHGMSSMAKVLLEMGYSVSGSDISPSSRLQCLHSLGASVCVGHDPTNVAGASVAVVSAAIPRDNVEIAAAKQSGIPVVTRAEALGKLVGSKFGIAVTGTHGKTTTSSMIGLMTIEAGLDPTIILGEEAEHVPMGGRYGQGELIVVEADEAYGSFLEIKPRIAVVTNIDDDHLDYYKNSDSINEAFATFLKGVDDHDLAVLFADDRRVMQVAKGRRCRKLLFGFDNGDLKARNPVIRSQGYEFLAVLNETPLGSVELLVPGRHNICNALASIAVGLELGIPFHKIKSGLGKFRGARRRLEFIGEVQNILVLDDYAHHPLEIEATISALKETYKRRLVVVFQPQRFTRTKLLFDRFVKAFSSADIIVITDIYHRGTGEQPLPGVTGEGLAEEIKKNSNPGTIFVKNLDEIARTLTCLVKPDDVVVTMGAGNIDSVAREFVQRMRDEWKE